MTTVTIKLKQSAPTPKASISKSDANSARRAQHAGSHQPLKSTSIEQLKQWNWEETAYNYPVEEQFILRWPATLKEMITKIRDHLKLRKDLTELLKIEFMDSRRAFITIDEKVFPAKLVDLPTITESYKTLDHKQFYKVNDICQMLLIEDKPVDTLLSKPFHQINYIVDDGLTNPLKQCRKRRFRKRVNKMAIQNVESEVNRLIQEDARASFIEWRIEQDQEAEEGTQIQESRAPSIADTTPEDGTAGLLSSTAISVIDGGHNEEDDDFGQAFQDELAKMIEQDVTSNKGNELAIKASDIRENMLDKDIRKRNKDDVDGIEGDEDDDEEEEDEDEEEDEEDEEDIDDEGIHKDDDDDEEEEDEIEEDGERRTTRIVQEEEEDDDEEDEDMEEEDEDIQQEKDNQIMDNLMNNEEDTSSSDEVQRAINARITQATFQIEELQSKMAATSNAVIKKRFMEQIEAHEKMIAELRSSTQMFPYM